MLLENAKQQQQENLLYEIRYRGPFAHDKHLINLNTPQYQHIFATFQII